MEAYLPMFDLDIPPGISWAAFGLFLFLFFPIMAIFWRCKGLFSIFFEI